MLRGRPGDPVVLLNAWDVGSAKRFAALGAEAIATTSSGFAATLGLGDGEVGRERSVAHAAELAAAVVVPVNADLEDGFGRAAEDVVATIEAAAATGLAGASIEDHDGVDGHAVYPFDEAVARVEAAVAAKGDLVLTARAEGILRRSGDLGDAIERLQAFAAAGADVVYAPGITALEDVRRVVAAVDVPVNVLLLPAGPSAPELADAGVARISVGGAFAFAAYAEAERLAGELLGTLRR
jgi:2-methylisocitrate lyase-like PEP mutase family enzyme